MQILALLVEVVVLEVLEEVLVAMVDLTLQEVLVL
jgi:hypothetical protein